MDLMTGKILEKQKKLDKSRYHAKIAEKNQILLENDLKKQKKLTTEALRLVKDMKCKVDYSNRQSVNPSSLTHSLKSIKVKPEFDEISYLKSKNEELLKENKSLRYQLVEKDTIIAKLKLKVKDKYSDENNSIDSKEEKCNSRHEMIKLKQEKYKKALSLLSISKSE